jgi:hypothetical protein
MSLPPDTKYKVAHALTALATDGLERMLINMDMDLLELEVKSVDRLYFTIRIRPNGGGAPRHIAVRISEPW